MTRSDAKDNKAKILYAFADLVKAGPSRLPSMTEIVKRSGLGRGTVYRHFPEVGDLVFAHLNEGYHEVCSSYEPEWINGNAKAIRARFEAFLLRFYDFNRRNHSILATPEFLTSEGRKLAKAELRRKIYVTLTRLSETPLKPVELTKWADVIACCVETEHIGSSSLLEARPDVSIGIGMTLLDACLE
ncbi:MULTISPECIES: TetR/AcrR family transcriptional regulator [Alphaproteobacteria]|uniref:TetR/AcrR family transcriptional regulator n=1 Tax=Alphaproteobacteria TaxID=28211 RepID=UPI0032667E38